MADPVAADSRLHIVGRGTGGGFPSGNGPAAARRSAGHDCQGAGTRRSVLVVLVCSGSDRARFVPQGRRLHRHHGFRNGLHQSRRRACHYHAGVFRLAVHLGRICRRTHHGRAAGYSFSAASQSQAFGRGKGTGRQGLTGRMEGHAEMDMSVKGGGTLWQRITSDAGFTAISHYFVMDVASVWMDIAGGLLISGALAAWVPADFWQSFFVVDHPLLAKLWGPIVGPLVAVISFVCSVGNIPLAAVLWNGGISFGGAIAFIFAD